MPQVVLATANPHKVAELRAIFADLGIPPAAILGLPDLPGHPFPEPAESGDTFEANALIKARAYAAATGLHCLADDSGLSVDALRGRPGVISSHYSTDGRETGLSRQQRDAANNARLLRDLEGLSPDRRTARFLCIMALAAPPGASSTPVTAQGAFEGRIGLPPDVPRGTHGFGYDPLFLVAPGFSHTSAQLSPADKNRLSHRAAAARAIAPALRTLTA